MDYSTSHFQLTGSSRQILKSLGGGRVLAGSPKASKKLTVHVQVYNHIHAGHDNWSYCLKINGAVWLRLRPSLKTISLAVDAHGSASPLKWVFQTGWSDVVEEVINELMRGRVEERREREHQRQLLDFRAGGNTRKSRHWSCWPPVGTRGVRDMLIFCSYIPAAHLYPWDGRDLSLVFQLFWKHN